MNVMIVNSNMETVHIDGEDIIYVICNNIYFINSQYRLTHRLMSAFSSCGCVGGSVDDGSYLWNEAYL